MSPASSESVAVLILAAGKSTRMQSTTPKVLHCIAGKPVLHYAIDAAESLAPKKIAIIVGDGMDDVAKSARGIHAIVQKPALGTGHAVQCARDFLRGFDGVVLVIYGDTPFLSTKTLSDLISAANQPNYAAAVMGFRPADPAAYGRLATDPSGKLQAIVEYADASEEQRRIGFCNAGIMAIAGAHFAALIDALDNKNSKGEFYLTDVIALARKRGLDCAAIEADAAEVMGINTRGELAAAEAIMQSKLRRKFMDAGVTLIDPESVYFSHDTNIASDVSIEPNVFFGLNVSVESGCRIKSFSHIEGAKIGPRVTIGPFARIRPDTVLHAGVHIGNFVEIKNSELQPGVKANHLSYLGDSSIGNNTNIGAGTITCNYDGFDKHRTTIGQNVFVGSNTAIIAPMTIGDGAIIAAGSVIAENVPADALGIARAPQTNKPGWAKRFRDAILSLKNKKAG